MENNQEIQQLSEEFSEKFIEKMPNNFSGFNIEPEESEKITLRQKVTWEMLKTRTIRKMFGIRLQPYVRETPKIGRNEKCYCGSGKKYKKCCGMN